MVTKERSMVEREDVPVKEKAAKRIWKGRQRELHIGLQKPLKNPLMRMSMTIKMKKTNIIGMILGSCHLHRFNRQERFRRLRCQTPAGVRVTPLRYLFLVLVTT